MGNFGMNYAHSAVTRVLSVSPGPPSRAPRHDYFRQQDLQAARATASLGCVLGLGNLDYLLARHRSAFCARRQMPSEDREPKTARGT